jgi:hypothetical protein
LRPIIIAGAGPQRNGADNLIGRRLAELYRHAGLYEIGIEARDECASPVTRAGRSALTWYAAFTR